MKHLSSFIIGVLLTASFASAQFGTAEVLGTIRDKSDQVLPSATVKLLNQDTGIESETQSDGTGNYTFTNVKIGMYTISAEATGFAKAESKDITLNVNARQRVDLRLEIGTVSQTIVVTNVATILQTDSSERGQVIQQRAIVELPLNGRAYSDLALLTTGVLKSPSSASREGSFIVNGLRSVFNNYVLDGVDNNAYGTSNQGFANQVAQPSPDSVAEFKVITNNYSAEYGRSGGGTIDVAMKSGTNAFHGTAYDFVRNTSLNAIGYVFGARPATFKKPTLNQNQFGFTLGGPIMKNRAFFFGDYEGFRSKARTLTFASIPTLNERQGILPVAVVNPQTGQTYAAGTPIPLTSFARKVLTDLPSLTGTGRSNNYQQLSLDQNYNDKYDAKLDGQIKSTMTAFARFSQRKVNIFNEPNIPGASGGNSNGYTRVLNQQFSAGYTWTMSPQSVFESRFGMSRTRAGKEPPLVGGPSMLAQYGITGLPEDPALVGGLTSQTISGYSALGRQATNPQFQNPLSLDYKFNYTRVTGRNTMKVGYEFVTIHTQVNDVNPLYGRDAYAGGFSRPSGAPADANSYSLADFYFGLRSQYALANYVVGDYRQHMNFLYVQNDYRVSRKLTLNLGMRWEYATPRWEKDNVLSNFDPETKTILKAKDGSVYDRSLVNPDRNNFAPRLGFAYSANSKTVIRGGYGVSYIHQNRVGSADLLGINYPQVVIATINQTSPNDAAFRTTQQGYPAGLTNASTFSVANANIAYIPKTFGAPWVQSYFLSAQRELMRDFVLDIGYVGNDSNALPLIADYNQAAPQPTATSNLSLAARRPIQGYGAITWFNPAGFSYYNALQVKLEKRFSYGLQFLNSFVWGKAIDNSGQSLDTNGGNDASPQDVRNLAAEKGLSNYDQKFTNVTSVVYQLPVGKGKKFGDSLHPALDAVIGGWEFSVINNALSAPPLNLRAWAGNIPAAFQTVGNLAGFRGGETFRPNVLGPVLAVNPQDVTNTFFNTANVVLPTDPSQPFGNSGRNSVRGIGLQQTDLGVHKNFQLPRESMRLQFRAEFFNVMNHTNFTAPNTDRNSAAFGTIRGWQPPRQVQFALKLYW